jgi:hypothetical protein
MAKPEWASIRACAEASAANGQLDAISANDRAWVGVHPDREYRERLLLPGECFGTKRPVGFPIVLVRQLAPGIHERYRCVALKSPPFLCEDPRGAVWGLPTDAVRHGRATRQ